MQSLLLKLYKNLKMTKKVQLYVQRVVNHQFLIGVTGVVFNDKNEVLLFKHSYRPIEWSLPGGYLQSGEHPKEGLEREIFEESGFKVKIFKIIKTTHDTETARLDMSYYGVYESGEFIKSAEVTEYMFCSISQLPSLLESQYEQIKEGYKRYISTKKKNIFENIKQFFWRN